ncbi:MAG: GNAT family N-acetyltransferase [Dehalococcoidales bacterium]|nr:GNAT family N-acetyltransferase [Dehalococcoidales bacterium]
MNHKIRPIVKEDRLHILNILKNTPEFSVEEVQVAVELIDLYLEKGESSGYLIQVAQVDFAAAGYICYGPSPMTTGTWDVYWIAVDPGKQRLGIGRSLLEYAENEIRKSSGRMIFIETSAKESYKKTRDFYESLQYREVARISDYYAPGDDKLILQKCLDTR